MFRLFFRNKPKLKLRIINQNSVSVLQTPEPETPTEPEPCRGQETFLYFPKSKGDVWTSSDLLMHQSLKHQGFLSRLIQNLTRTKVRLCLKLDLNRLVLK